MKVRKESIDFVPITIVLETEEEYLDMMRHIGSVHKKSDLVGVEEKIADRVFGLGVGIYRRLTNVIKEG